MSDEPTPYRKKRGAIPKKFGIECRFGFRQKVQPKQRWVHWKWYDREANRDKALEGLSKKCKGHILFMEFRASKR